MARLFVEETLALRWDDLVDRGLFLIPAVKCAIVPNADGSQIQQLVSCHFIEHGENLVILGKSHVAIGLGLKAIERGHRVLPTTAAAMMATLTRALTETRLEDKLKLYTIPRLLIIDEIGYLPIDRTGANLFFQLISRRYEKGPMILTSNQSFGAWGEVFGGCWRPRYSIGSCATPSQSIFAAIPTIEGESQSRTRGGGRNVNGKLTRRGNFR